MDSPLFLWILGATMVNSLIALVGIFTLWINKEFSRKIIYLLVALSAGAFLAGALFHLAAESLEHLSGNIVFGLMIFGFCLFFVAERFLWWHHCHEGECDVHPVTYLILFGDGLHNFIDGAVIAASFFVSVTFGIITTLLIISHEVPQELGDFGVLVYGGFSERKALLYNFISQVVCILGALLVFFMGNVSEFTRYILPFAAGGFLYISASDLIPELHRERDKKHSFISFFVFLLGIFFMVGLKYFAG
jgi:zinc and cadmium transporter